MNWQIVFGIVRAVGPSLLSFIAGRYPQFAGPIMEVAALLGTGGAAGWSAMVHTDSAKLSAVEALGAKIIAPPGATGALAQAAADPTRPNVVASSTS